MPVSPVVLCLRVTLLLLQQCLAKLDKEISRYDEDFNEWVNSPSPMNFIHECEYGYKKLGEKDVNYYFGRFIKYDISRENIQSLERIYRGNIERLALISGRDPSTYLTTCLTTLVIRVMSNKIIPEFNVVDYTYITALFQLHTNNDDTLPATVYQMCLKDCGRIVQTNDIDQLRLHIASLVETYNTNGQITKKNEDYEWFISTFILAPTPFEDLKQFRPDGFSELSQSNQDMVVELFEHKVDDTHRALHDVIFRLLRTNTR